MVISVWSRPFSSLLLVKFSWVTAVISVFIAPFHHCYLSKCNGRWSFLYGLARFHHCYKSNFHGWLRSFLYVSPLFIIATCQNVMGDCGHFCMVSPVFIIATSQIKIQGGVWWWWRSAKRTGLAAKFWIFWRGWMTELGALIKPWEKETRVFRWVLSEKPAEWTNAF